MVVATICNFEICVVIGCCEHSAFVETISQGTTVNLVPFGYLLYGVANVVIVRYAEKSINLRKLLFKGVKVSLGQATCDDNFFLFVLAFVLYCGQYFIYCFIFGIISKCAGVDDDNVCFIFCASGDSFYEGRVLTTPYHYAYLKIADGCNNHCTYCAIPSIRGKDRSEKMEDLLTEAKGLEREGVRELILVAQDVTRYGIDFDGKSHLVELVDKLSEMDFDRIRLLYLEPEAIDDEIIDMIVSNPKVVKYADVPLQHIDNDTLKRMGRRCDEATTRALIKKLRDNGIVLRSSFICGFPGESEEAHQKLVDFIREGNIDYAGFFAYSREEGTAADKLQNHLDDAVKVERTNRLKDLQTEVINNRNNSLVGKTLSVLFDEIDYDKQMFVGRAEFQAPDIDNIVYFTADKEVHVGEFYDVEIVATDGIDLVGKAL